MDQEQQDLSTQVLNKEQLKLLAPTKESLIGHLQ